MLVWNRPALLFISLRLAAGAMGHGPKCFRLLTNNTTHCKKFGKNCKNIWSAKARSPMGPDGPRWGPMGQPLKKTTTYNTRSSSHYRSQYARINTRLFHSSVGLLVQSYGIYCLIL